MKRYLLLILFLLLTSCVRDNLARVIFDNQSACGTISATLTDTETGEVKRVEVPVGKRMEVVVRPDIFYNYLVDFTAAGRTPDDFRCVAVKSGKVSVPAGSSQVFALQAETPVPTPQRGSTERLTKPPLHSLERGFGGEACLSRDRHVRERSGHDQHVRPVDPAGQAAVLHLQPRVIGSAPHDIDD